MINSLIIAFLGYASLAVVAILDKSILSKTLREPAIYAFYSTIFSVVAFFFLPWVGVPKGFDLLWSVVSGLSFGSAVWLMFIAFRHGEASHLSPFVGAVIATFSFVFSGLFLKSPLTIEQTIGIGVLILASFLLSFEKSREHDGFHVGFIWAVLSALLFSISHVSAKYLYGSHSFFEGLVWSRGFISLIGFFILIIPAYRSQIFNRSINPKETGGLSKSGLDLGLVFLNKALGIIATLLIQLAIFLGNVAVINALAGLQYVLMFLFICLLTKLTPKFFSEYFTVKEIITQSFALALIVVGLIFL